MQTPRSSPPLVDTHCHLTDPRFDGDRAATIDRARAAGVTRIVAVGGGGPIEMSEAAVELAAARRSDMRATAGIHPHDAKTYDDQIEARIAVLAERGAIAAVGETGLDYYYEHSPRDVQRSALARQLALARRYDLPIVLHCRDAEADLREVLAESTGSVRGVVHCFTGTYEDARWYVDKGLLVSFTGIITFKNADALREVARRLPLDRVMVETDSPYLAPVPHRGKRNEPAFVTYVAHTLAELRGVSLEAVAEATTANAVKLFFGE